jgi:hypothetical protein
MTKLIVSQAAGSYSAPVQPGLPYLPPFGDQYMDAPYQYPSNAVPPSHTNGGTADSDD